MYSIRKFLITVLTILTVLAVFVSPVAAQNNSAPTAFLVYYDDDFEIEVFDSSGEYVGEVFTGMELFPGSTIKTYNTTAEIQLDPNGSILKIAENSIFEIEAFQTTADESNDFTLFSGKLRVIAARAGLGYENYSIMTESAVCGVRGTDFVLDSIGVLAVKDGAVEFSSLLDGNSINVAAGQIADVFADTFEAVTASAQSLASIFSGMDFIGTDPSQVPGHTVTPDEPTDDAEEEVADTEEEEKEQPEVAEETTAEKPVPVVQGSAAANITGKTTPPPAKEKDEVDEKPEPPKEPGPFDEFFDGLADLLSFEIGSITIDDTTYAKAVIQPEFEIGELKMGLYLPVIYRSNLFNPDDWYKPAGNNEWSFGTDQSDIGSIALDVMSDLFLKIRYIQWGDNGDDFYLKFGNLDNMTIGHGILMYNFANNIEFPAVRKVGINTGINFDYFGLEAVVDDAADPTIFGGRLVYIPFGPDFPFELGLSSVADINPDSEFETDRTLFDTVILNGAFDLGFPIDFLGLTLFADAASFTIYNSSGWHTETFYDAAETDIIAALNNYGISAGLYGDIFSIIDYRLEYRYSKGLFRSSFYNKGYLMNKSSYLEDIDSFLASPNDAAYQDVTMGVYGELSADLFDAVTLEGGYLWPWKLTGSEIDYSAEDYFHIAANLMPGVIPVVGLYGSVSYTRTDLVGSIKDSAEGNSVFMLFDGKTVFNGEVVYPFDDFLDIALQFSTALSRDNDGNIIYDADGNAEIYSAFTIDTRIHF